MNFTFDFGWVIGGLVIALMGGLIVIFHRQIAGNFKNSVSSYEKVKLFGIVTLIVGFLIAINLHIFILELINGLILKNN